MIVEDNSIVICPSDVKDDLILQFNQFPDIRVKYFSKEELIEGTYFKYDDNAIVYLMKKGYCYSNAKELLENFKGLVNIDGNAKIASFISLYNELKQNNLLKRDYLFKEIFKNKSIYVIGYSKFDEELKYLLKEALHLDYQFVENSQGELRPSIYEFDNMEDEISNLFLEITKLYNKGVSLNEMYLMDYPSNYDLTIKKYANAYRLPIEFKTDFKLKDTPVFKEYISNLEKGLSLEEAFNNLKDYSYDDYGAKQKLVNIVNDVMNVKDNDFDKINLLKEKAKKTSLKHKTYDNSIKITSSSKKGYVFIVGFSLGDYPSFCKDTDLLSDNEKQAMHKNTSLQENRISEDCLNTYITNQPNLYISRMLKDGKEEKYDTAITKALKLPKERITDSSERFNRSLAEIEVAKSIDLDNDYGIKTNKRYALDEDEIRYNAFNHKFNPSPLFKNNDKLDVSYSQINEYYECPFMYFIKRICKLNAFEDTFYTNLGTIFHAILKDSLDGTVNLEKYQKDIGEKFTTSKDKFFINLLLPQVLKVIEKNEQFKNVSSFTRSIGEQKFIVHLDEKTNLIGYVDKVIFNDENKELIVIDYKTGDLHFNKKKVEFGLNLQLPTYGILLKENYPSYTQQGTYIQRICVKNIDEKSYRLDGITKASVDLFRRLDHSMDKDSTFVKGINIKNDGGYRANNSIIEEEEYNKLIEDAYSNIKQAIEKIRNGEFDIAPTLFNDSESHCKDCPLGAVCFHDPQDYRRVYPKEKEEPFLTIPKLKLN